MNRVFVYGTLKTGEPNYGLLQDKGNGYSKYLGAAVSTKKYPLIIGTKYNIPFLLYAPGVGHFVEGEIYEVDKPMLDRLDELEGHPEYYVRELDKFVMKNSELSSVECWVYFLKNYPEDALSKEFLSNYTSGIQGKPYIDSYNESTPEDLKDI